MLMVGSSFWVPLTALIIPLLSLYLLSRVLPAAEPSRGGEFGGKTLGESDGGDMIWKCWLARMISYTVVKRISVQTSKGTEENNIRFERDHYERQRSSHGPCRGLERCHNRYCTIKVSLSLLHGCLCFSVCCICFICQFLANWKSSCYMSCFVVVPDFVKCYIDWKLWHKGWHHKLFMFRV